MWKLVRVWILFSWSFLTIGILLGSWWAYHELGWGGWWFWDPVENASLMPWLLATACVHSITKPKLNYWTLIFTQTTFILSVLGTFFVRSGLLSSVHSFATDSTRGLYLLLFFIFITIISVFNWISFCLNTSLYGILSRFQTNFGLMLHSKNLFKFWARLWSNFKHRSGSFHSLFKMPQFRMLRSTRLAALRIQFCKNPPGGPLSSHHRPKVFLDKVPEPGGPPFRRVHVSRETLYTLSEDSSTRNWVETIKQKRTTKSARKVNFLRKRKKPEGDAFGKGALAYEKPEVHATEAGSHITLARANKTTATVFLTTELPYPKGIEGPLGVKALIAKGGLLFIEMKRSIEQILFLQNFYLCIICLVVFCGTSAPLFFQWLWGRDVGTGAPFYNAICIPLFTSVFFVLTYVHYIQFSLLNRLVLYCIFFFLVHVVLCVQIIGFNFLESIYAAICVLLISSILLSTYLRGTNSSGHNTLVTSFLSLPSRHLVLAPSMQRIKVIHATRFLDGSLQMSIAHIGLVIFIIGILFSNVFKFEFTEQLHSGPSGIRLGSQICCLRSIDHSFAPTYHSICANLLVYKQDNIESSQFFTGSLSRFVHNTKQALEGERFEHQGAELCMFPEKRFYYLNDVMQGGPNAGSLASKVAIQSNLFTDFYSLIGTGSFETGWFTTIMKLPFIFCIWLGFLFGVIGGVFSLKKQLQKPRLYWP